MEEEVFVANNRSEVKALGMKVNCTPSDLHIYGSEIERAKSKKARDDSYEREELKWN